MFTFLAQQPTGLGGSVCGEGFGPFGAICEWSAGSAIEKFAGAISAIIGFLTIMAGLFFIFQFLAGALQWIASGGDKTGLQAAQQKLTNSFIGLILVVAAMAIISLLSTFLGFEFLNLEQFVKAIGFK